MNVITLLASDGYIVLNKQLLIEIGLNEALLLGELCSEYNYYEKQGAIKDGWFYSTAENVYNNTTLSIYQQNNAIKSLIKLGFIEVKIMGMPATRHIQIFQNKIVSFLQTSIKETNKQDCEKLASKNNKVIIINKSNNEDKDIISGKPDYTADVHTIIDYLNNKTQQSYRYSESSMRHIRARLAEKFTVTDCKKVIDTKTEEWGKDDKMRKYLRPETLFGGKFENYLNQKAEGEEVIDEEQMYWRNKMKEKGHLRIEAGDD